MAGKKYYIEMHDDGTFISVPSVITFIPGTTITIYVQAKELLGTIYKAINLQGATLIFTIADDTNAVRIYQTGTPTIAMINGPLGKFTVTLSPQLTKYLLPGKTHTMEVKAEFPGGEKRQLCYLPLSVGNSILINE